MTALRLIAPAKINWSLDVLRQRADGYHEIRSVMQTIDLHDVITLRAADGIELELRGDAGALAADDPARNLAYRAAKAFHARTGIHRGVRITIEKRIPVAAGFGGGSSDAAALLRGLNVLWGAEQPELNLVEIAAEVGVDGIDYLVVEFGEGIGSLEFRLGLGTPDLAAASKFVTGEHQHRLPGLGLRDAGQ